MGGGLFNLDRIEKVFLGFVCFCLISSSIYIINDYKDVEKDKNHPKKKNRPLASGKISKKKAIIILIVLLFSCILISLLLNNCKGFLLLMLYFVLNILYSLGLKNKPITDTIILASGFVIRVFYGGIIANVDISMWLFLVVTTGSLYMGLGKRRNELKDNKNTREVLKYYNVSFLDKNMYVFVALVDMFYSLWATELQISNIKWTVPIFIIIMMRYSYDIEGDSDGDPVDVILKDIPLILMIIMLAVLMFVFIYVGI